MSRKNHAAGKAYAGAKNHASKKIRPEGNEFRKNPFISLKGDASFDTGSRENRMSREDTQHVAELIGSILEEMFGTSGEEGMCPVVGVIELNPEDGLSLEIQDLKNQALKQRSDHAVKSSEAGGRNGGHKGNVPAMPPCDGCGEEIFQEMLRDLNAMAKLILEADHMMKMVSEEGVSPEDARCVTYLSIYEARAILKKWEAYRRCEI